MSQELSSLMRILDTSKLGMIVVNTKKNVVWDFAYFFTILEPDNRYFCVSFEIFSLFLSNRH